MASVEHCSPLDNSSEDYEVIPDDAPHTVVPFPNRSRGRSRSPFSYLSQILPGAFKRKDAEPPPQQQAEQHSGEETDMVELEAVAVAVSSMGGRRVDL